MPLTVNSDVRELPGVGETRAKALDKLGLRTVGDLLRYLPRGYEDRRPSACIRTAPAQLPVCVRAMVAESPRLSRIRRGLELTRVRAVDQTGAMTITFFNQNYVKNALRAGEEYVFFGRVEGPPGRRQMTNPEFEPADRARFTGRILPVYPLTKGISNHLLASLTLQCVERCAGQMTETLPPALLAQYGLPPMEESLRSIHFPAAPEDAARARRRFIFEELLQLSCGLALLKGRRDQAAGRIFRRRDPAPFFALLPFPLTGAQRRAMEDMARDMASGRPMNRLVQGDVGSGKTMLAAYGAWLAAQNGCQTALMAPTELLAEQHFRSLAPLLAPAGVRTALLTGAVKGARRRQVCQSLREGEVDLMIGTQALISEGVEYAALGLVITDEQHRFGVDQRSALAAKGAPMGGASAPPHVLVMSATPIPRTLALIIYGDLDMSVLDELPPGRTPVKTYVIGEDKRQRMYGFVRKLVGEGRQVYMVCPSVVTSSELPESAQAQGQVPSAVPPFPAKPASLGFLGASENESDLKAAVAYAKELGEKIFPDLRVGLVHGRMKAGEKDAAMAAFAAGALDILVSTTVIEVGVDVPNAALMVVENAERFGLSQLHQLRGRVGRGRHQSYCVLVSSAAGPDSRERLKVLASTTDGFRISEEDLRLRGPGDFFGQRQHGLPDLRIADLASDMAVLTQAQDAAARLLEEDPRLERPEHRRLLGQVKRMFADRTGSFN